MQLHGCVPLILLGTRRLYEVIDSRSSRYYVELAVPGVSAFTLPGALAEAGKLDHQRLEAAVLNLRDERQLAQALLALASLRLSPNYGRRSSFLP